MKEGIQGKKSPLASGWILVSGLLILCVVVTWLTAHNYKQHVFSSARGIVLENQWPESRIEVLFSEKESRAIRPGQVANITMSDDKHLLKGVVVSVSCVRLDPDAIVTVRLVDEPVETGVSGATNSPKSHHYLPAGKSCNVTIDTTIPADALGPDKSGAQ
jgi:hypothetical protein